MTGGDDDYGDAFKEAKLEHDQRRQGSAEAQRLQAEADADTAALSNVVLPQLQAAAQKLEPLGGKVEIRQHGLVDSRRELAIASAKPFARADTEQWRKNMIEVRATIRAIDEALKDEEGLASK
jgi:hypothetical protein